MLDTACFRGQIDTAALVLVSFPARGGGSVVRRSHDAPFRKLDKPAMPTLEELTQETREVAHIVHAAEERRDERDLVASAHQRVNQLSDNYRALCASLPEGERLKVERTLGRRITDLRRLASLLPRIGFVADERTPDRQVAGASEVGERRITGLSWNAGSRAAPAGSGLRVGGEVDAWCGPCDGMTTHRIIAMVGTEPKQVVCDACGGRHGYRTTPARGGTVGGKPSAEGPSGYATPQELEAQRRAEQKAEELRALGREVAAAENVRLFDPKQRYKPGEIISHPDFGRGKVDTVLRSSMLVRFPNGGLKSLILD